MDNLIFYVTVPNFEEGKKIARTLLENKIAACVNIIKNIYSTYWWKNEIEEVNESLLIIKTNDKKSNELIKKVNELHTYEVPECVGIRICKGSRSYIDWINQVLLN